MANVNNDGISAKIGVGNLLEVNLKIGGSTAEIPEHETRNIFQNLNENYTKNPNHTAPNEVAGDRNDGQFNQGYAKGNQSEPPAQNNGNNGNHGDIGAQPRNNGGNNNNGQAVGEDGNLVNSQNRGKNGDLHASETGLLNGRGHHKTENGGNNQTPPIVVLPGDNGKNNQTEPVKTPPIINLPTTENPGNTKTGGTINTPPIVIMPGTDVPTNSPHNTPRLPDISTISTLKSYANQTTILIQTVVSQILRQNDVYLRNNALNQIIYNQTSRQNDNQTQTNQQTNVPREIQSLVQNVSNRVLSMLDNSLHNGKLIHQISKEISQQMRDNIQSAKTVLLKNGDLGATAFKNLNIGERMHVAVEMMPRHLPEHTQQQIQNYKANEILNALLLARGLIVPGENGADVKNLISAQTTVLPREISMTNLRDVGQLVKILIADTAMAKSTANLDLAVQKFVRILLANNELGVLLATVNLASQTNQGGLISRSLALAQIYQLINQLLLAGEKAMKEAMPENNLSKDKSALLSVGLSAVDDLDDSKSAFNKLHANGAESALKQFLEFNPACVYDKSASAFSNPDDSRSAQKDFVNLYHNDIEQWLKSGNHRFVKDYDFDKPVGVVVERNSDNVFTANTARFVLVRDGSVQGWHFLKSFLVK